jgi:hypothetical protein
MTSEEGLEQYLKGWACIPSYVVDHAIELHEQELARERERIIDKIEELIDCYTSVEYSNRETANAVWFLSDRFDLFIDGLNQLREKDTLTKE